MSVTRSPTISNASLGGAACVERFEHGLDGEVGRLDSLPDPLTPLAL